MHFLLLSCLGASLLTAVNYALTIECKVVFDRLNFTSVFSLFFAAFFVMNIEYPFEAASTMEFIQRYLYVAGVSASPEFAIFIMGV